MSFPAYVPADRLRPLVLAWLGKHGSLKSLARLSGIPERTLWALLHGERATVRFSTADRILIAIDAVEEWHLPPEQGGLADLFEDVA